MDSPLEKGARGIEINVKIE